MKEEEFYHFFFNRKRTILVNVYVENAQYCFFFSYFYIIFSFLFFSFLLKSIFISFSMCRFKVTKKKSKQTKILSLRRKNVAGFLCSWMNKMKKKEEKKVINVHNAIKPLIFIFRCSMFKAVNQYRRVDKKKKLNCHI